MPRPAYNLFPGGKSRCLTLSYDDGRDHDRRLVEIFNRYGVRCSFHLNSGRFDKENHITSAEVAELFKGHEISAHTVNHPWLERIPEALAIREITEDRLNLEKLAGYPVRGMSYPFGTYNQRIVTLLPSLGIEYARAVQSTRGFGTPENFHVWLPTCHHNDAHSMIEGFVENWRAPLLFYVWGHSYEFANNDNWELIEDFCQKVSGRDDTWYATNIEIVDYVNATRGLRFSADFRTVLNPSATEVWFTEQESGQKICVPAGARVDL